VGGESKEAANVKAVGYVRVSTERQEISPDAQRHMLAQWAESAGAELLVIHEDRVSGGLKELRSELVEGVATTRVDLRVRPGLLAAVDDVHRLGAGALVAVKRDRILRDLEGMRVVQRLIAPARILATSFAIDETTTLGRFAVGVVDLQAEAERGQIQDRTEASLAQRRREGRRVGELRLGESVDDDGKVIPNADELAAIELMLELRRERGWGRRRIATELQRLHEASGRTQLVPRGTRWQPGTVGRVLARHKSAGETT
jgi:DNA invertase Pin-like site-specific DNA recombinase